MVEDDLLQVHFHLLHLPQDDAPLPLDGRVLKLGVLQNVGENFHGLAFRQRRLDMTFSEQCPLVSVSCLTHVPRETFGVEDGLLARGVGVEVGAHVLDLQLQGALRALGGSLRKRRRDSKRLI